MIVYKNRHMVKGEDLNGTSGTLFGGRALAWIDEAAAIYAFCQLGKPYNLVTKAMSKINFQAPARQGDIVEIGFENVKIGTTSITIKCLMRNMTTEVEIVTIDEITFVNVDRDGKPLPHGLKKTSGSILM